MPDVGNDDLSVRDKNGETKDFPGDVQNFDVKGSVLTVVTDKATVWTKDWESVELSATLMLSVAAWSVLYIVLIIIVVIVLFNAVSRR